MEKENVFKNNKHGLRRETQFKEPIRVLHVDDEKVCLKVTKYYLEGMTWVEIIVDSLLKPELVEGQLQEYEYDVIVSDYQMQPINGIELLQLLRTQNNDIPFIMLTGRGREEIAIEALNLGANRYIKKGMDTESMYGELYHAIKSVVDHYRTQKALHEREAQFRSIADSSLVGLVIFQDKEIKYTSLGLEHIHGYTKEEVYEWTLEEMFEIIHSDDLQQFLNLIYKIGRGELKKFESFQLRLFSKSKELVWVEIYGTLMIYQGKPAILTQWIDITQRNKAEEKLKESEEKFRLIAESALVGMVIIQDNQLKYVNKAMIRITGHPREIVSNWTAKEFLNTIHPEDLPIVKEQLRLKQTGIKNGLMPSYQFRIITPTNEVRWINNYSNTLSYQGKTANFITLVDITEQKRAEIALKESEQRYRRLVEDSPEAIAIHCDGKAVYMNTAGIKLFGASHADEIIGKPLLDFIHPDFRKIAIERVKKVLEDGEQLPYMTTKLIRLDGQPFDAEVRGTAIIYHKKPAIQVVFRDITERR